MEMISRFRDQTFNLKTTSSRFHHQEKLMRIPRFNKKEFLIAIFSIPLIHDLTKIKNAIKVQLRTNAVLRTIMIVTSSQNLMTSQLHLRNDLSVQTNRIRKNYLTSMLRDLIITPHIKMKSHNPITLIICKIVREMNP